MRLEQRNDRPRALTGTVERDPVAGALLEILRLVVGWLCDDWKVRRNVHRDSADQAARRATAVSDSAGAVGDRAKHAIMGPFDSTIGRADERRARVAPSPERAWSSNDRLLAPAHGVGQT